MEVKKLFNLKTMCLFLILLIISSFILGVFGFWGTATIITCPTQAVYGFPLSFITYCENSISGEINYGFNFPFLILNIIIWYIVSLALILVYEKIK